MAALNDCVCQHVGYCDGSCQPSSPETGIKSCPFCGGQATREELTDEDNFGGSVICCTQCGASSPVHFDRKENLIDSWNRRASTTSAGVTEEQTPASNIGLAIAVRYLKGAPGIYLAKEISDAITAERRAALEASRVAPASQKEAVAKYPLATFGHADVLPLGIYRIHWKSGGSSLAAVGMMENGDRWLAPTNWTAPNMDPTNEWSWGDIDRAEPIPAPAPAVEPVGIKALEWTSEPPYSVARPFAGMHYATEVIWPDNGGRFDYVLLSGPTIGSKRFTSLSDAKAAAQADYEARIRSALHPTPTPVSAPVGAVTPATAARFARLLGICHRILWTDVGKPALDNEQTKGALDDLSEFLFADGLDEALRSPAVEGK